MIVIKLCNEGKTYREITHMAGVSPRDIKPILKKYERKIESKKEQENNQQQITTKKLSLSSRAFILFRKGKNRSEVKVILDIPFQQAIRFWAQYLKSIRMFYSFEFYQKHSYDIPTFLSINNFMERNNVSGIDIVNVLRQAKTIANLQLHLTIIKNEIERLQKIKNNQ